MATGTRGTNTQQEALKSTLSQIAEMKTMPDADLPYLINLETMILGKLRAPVDQLMQMYQGQNQGNAQAAPPQPSPAAGPPGMGAPPGVGGGMAPPGAGMPPAVGGPIGGGVPGLRSNPGMPNPDELRRLFTLGK